VLTSRLKTQESLREFTLVTW